VVVEAIDLAVAAALAVVVVVAVVMVVVVVVVVGSGIERKRNYTELQGADEYT